MECVEKYICPVLLVLTALIRHTSQAGFCQVYSYNVADGTGRLKEKHYFVCCDNLAEAACRGHTYQKPDITDAFCTGGALSSPSSSASGGTWSQWTQVETGYGGLTGGGRIYCGDCCGQHMAALACDARHGQQDTGSCTNWMQCFLDECKDVVSAISANQPLICDIPPPPFPRHFLPNMKTLPPGNVTVQAVTQPTRPTPASPAHGQYDAIHGDGRRHNISNQYVPSMHVLCSKEECAQYDMDERCRRPCCSKECCLPDGEVLHPSDHSILGLSPSHFAAIVLGTLATFIGVFCFSALVYRKLTYVCTHRHVPHKDAQILVIEAPDEMDSDSADV